MALADWHTRRWSVALLPDPLVVALVGRGFCLRPGRSRSIAPPAYRGAAKGFWGAGSVHDANGSVSLWADILWRRRPQLAAYPRLS